MTKFLTTNARGAVALTFLQADAFKAWLPRQPVGVQAWLKDTGFAGKPGSIAHVPDSKGNILRVVAGIADANDPWSYAGFPGRLGHGKYQVEEDLMAPTAAALGWGLGTYQFTRYKKREGGFATLVWPKGADRDQVTYTVEATSLVRDLINTPASDMGPIDLAAAARDLARKHSARVSVIAGNDLLKKDYPTIHAVGRASVRPPCLIDLRWGRAADPKVTLVGKGVCFDTGGLDLKSAAGMRLMKKDMGGAAHVLGLAHMVMATKLPVRLRVLIPAVENSVAGNALRPLDVITTRKGLTVEVGNTDAEGRLVLCDALVEADREKPDLVIDCATLTGAARVALGPSLPALFCNDDALAADLLNHGTVQRDPMWRMPLWEPYRRHLDSPVADLNNVSEGAHGGSITAALFLQEFISATTKWAHVDMMAWNPSGRHGHPAGAEAQGLRAFFATIAARYGRRSTGRKR